MFSRPPAHPLDRDLRRLRKILAGMLIFLLLPWLFVQTNISCNQFSKGLACRNEQQQEDPLPEAVPVAEAEPVPATYPVYLTYVPMANPVLEAWVNQHYPGTLLTPSDFGQIALAAKKMNVSEILLLGILGAEQGFVSPGNGNGAWGNLYALQNPFDYGVYPGSPFAHNIGVYQSALGAAALVARQIEAFPPNGSRWTATTLQQFYLALSGTYVNGNANAIDLSWLHNVASVSSSLWHVVAVNWRTELTTLLSLIGPIALLAQVPHLAHSVIGIVKHIDTSTVTTVTDWLTAIGVSVTVAAIIAEIVGVIVSGAAACGAVAAAA